MVKSYYHTFGSQLSIDELTDLLRRRLELEFEPRESSYIGSYWQYSGRVADKITIESNLRTDSNEWKEEKFKQYPVLVYVSNFRGKNVEKKARSEALKTRMREVPHITLLKEVVMDTAD
jgi:hypothetical protein